MEEQETKGECLTLPVSKTAKLEGLLNDFIEKVYNTHSELLKYNLKQLEEIQNETDEIEEWLESDDGKLAENASKRTQKVDRKRNLSYVVAKIKENSNYGFKFISIFRSYLENCENLSNLLTSYFGEDRWDCLLEYKEEDGLFSDNSKIVNFSYIFHYPEFIITNGSSKNLMRDLYTFLNFDVEFEISTLYGYTFFEGVEEVGYFQGQRATVSSKEYQKGYNHSHLPGDCFQKSNFCLGSGPLSHITTDLLNDNYNEELWEAFLYQSEDYIRWESIEGGPYKRLRKLNTGNNTNFSHIHTSSYISSIIKHILKRRLFSIHLNKDGIDLELDLREIEEFVIEHYYFPHYLCIEVDGKYYNIDNGRRSSNHNGIELFKFNNNIVKTKIKDNEQKEPTKEELTLHPKLLWEIKNSLLCKVREKIRTYKTSSKEEVGGSAIAG